MLNQEQLHSKKVQQPSSETIRSHEYGVHVARSASATAKASLFLMRLCCHWSDTAVVGSHEIPFVCVVTTTEQNGRKREKDIILVQEVVQMTFSVRCPGAYTIYLPW